MAISIFSCRDGDGNIAFNDDSTRTSCVGRYPLCRAADGTLWAYVPGCDDYQGSDGWYPVCRGYTAPFGGGFSVMKIDIPDCCKPIKIARQAWEDMATEEQPGDIDFNDFYLDIYGSENSVLFTSLGKGSGGYDIYQISATRAGIFKVVYISGDAGWSHAITVFKNGTLVGTVDPDIEIPYTAGDIFRIHLAVSETNGYTGWHDELRPDGLAPCRTTFY